MRTIFALILLFAGLCWADANRPVRIGTVAFMPPLPLEEVVKLVTLQAETGTDLILLPEALTAEPLEGETIQALSKIAANYRTYILCPIYRLDGGRRMNSAILIDRKGAVVYPIYDKRFPFWAEFDQDPPTTPGSGPLPIYDLDFGRIGICICFDLNFPSLWKKFFDEKVEMVVWPSAYSGGFLLRSYAAQYHYYIVSCTQIPDCTAIDIDGSEILYEKKNLSRIELDFDRSIYHYDFHMELVDKLTPLLRDHGEGLLERKLEREKWFILKTNDPKTSVRELAKTYGFEELSDYLRRSEKEISALIK